MRNVILVILALALVGTGTAGGYVYGRQTAQNEAQATRSRFVEERGAPVGGQVFVQRAAPVGVSGPGVVQMGGPGGEATLGAVKAVSGTTLELSGANGEVKVQVTDQTTIQQTVQQTVTLADLKPGVDVIVIGERDSQGAVTAKSINVIPRLSSTP